MAKPTPDDVLYQWHRQALADVTAGLRLEVPLEPQCGWYMRKLVRGGVLVAVKINMVQETDADGDLVRDEELAAWVAHVWHDPHDIWSYCAGRPISESDYNFMMARAQYHGENLPGSPFAEPRQAVDWLAAPIPKFKARPQ